MTEFSKYNRSGGADGAVCVKCGTGDPSKRWHAADFDCGQSFHGTEHMHLVCVCTYEWPTKPLDAS